ncbi:hypothetical protein Tco_1472243 [Tanacetum coccineum]
MWNRVRRLMQGTDLSEQEKDSRLSNEFDKFTSVAGESIESVYKRFSRLMNDMDRHEQNEVNVNASKAKGDAKVHAPLALVANTYESPSHSHSSSAYYVTPPPSVSDFDDDTPSYAYQNDIQTYSNTRNQAYVQDGRVDVQTNNVGDFGSAGRITGRNVGSSGTTALSKAKSLRFQELNASCIMMAPIETVANDSDVEPSYDSDFVDEETIKPRYGDDQIDSNIIFDDPYKGINSDNFEQHNHAHDHKVLNLKYCLEISIEVNNISLLRQERESLKENFKQQEDKYLDDILRLEAKLKDHERIAYKVDHSLQTIHMLGPKPNSFYDPSLKSGLGYQNPYRLQMAIAQNPKLYSATSLRDSKVHVHVHDSEEIL